MHVTHAFHSRFRQHGRFFRVGLAGQGGGICKSLFASACVYVGSTALLRSHFVFVEY